LGEGRLARSLRLREDERAGIETGYLAVVRGNVMLGGGMVIERSHGKGVAREGGRGGGMTEVSAKSMSVGGVIRNDASAGERVVKLGCRPLNEDGLVCKR
jgi:hypothetical protein